MKPEKKKFDWVAFAILVFSILVLIRGWFVLVGPHVEILYPTVQK